VEVEDKSALYILNAFYVR